MEWASDFNAAGGGAAAYIKSEIDQAVRPLQERVDQLEGQIRQLQEQKPRSLVQRVLGTGRNEP